MRTSNGLWTPCRDYGDSTVFLCYALHPFLECLETSFRIVELQQFLFVLVVAPVKYPDIGISLPTSLPTIKIF